MRRASILILGAVSAVLAGRWLAELSGENARLHWLVALLGVYGAVSLAVATSQWLVERRLRRADPKRLAELEARNPDLASVVADRRRMNELRDWPWVVTAHAWGVVAVAAPLTLLPWLRTNSNLQADSPILATDILALAAAVISYFLVRRHALLHYRCRRCRETLPRLAGGSPRYACARCGIVWRLS
jgi:hypothetical protein